MTALPFLLALLFVAKASAQDLVCPAQTCVANGGSCTADLTTAICHQESYCDGTLHCVAKNGLGGACNHSSSYGQVSCGSSYGQTPLSCSTNNVCVVAPLQLYPNDPCVATSDCITGLACISGKCALQNGGTTCRNSDQCPFETYCNTQSKCVSIAGAGGACVGLESGGNDDQVCGPLLVCGSPGTCIVPFTFANGATCLGSECEINSFCNLQNASPPGVCTAIPTTPTSCEEPIECLPYVGYSSYCACTFAGSQQGGQCFPPQQFSATGCDPSVFLDMVICAASKECSIQSVSDPRSCIRNSCPKQSNCYLQCMSKLEEPGLVASGCFTIDPQFNCLNSGNMVAVGTINVFILVCVILFFGLV